MAVRAYIIDFFEPGEVADAYHQFLSKGEMFLSTGDPLEIGERVRVRFNLPDGHGVVLRAKVIREFPDAGFALLLPDTDDTVWLLDKAKAQAEKLEKAGEARRKKARQKDKKKAAPPTPPPRPMPPPEPPDTTPPPKTPPPTTPKAGRRPDQVTDATVTQPLATMRPKAPVPLKPTSATFEEEDSQPAASPLSGDDSGKSLQEVAESLAPSHDDLLLSVSKLDAWLSDQMLKGGGTSTIPVSPPTTGPPPKEHANTIPIPAAPDLKPGEAQDAESAVHRLDSALASLSTQETVMIPVEEQPKLDPFEARIRRLSTQQKKKLAISGLPEERRRLMTDDDRSLQIWVMKNPELTEEEVLQYSKMTSLSQEALGFLLQSRKWATTPKIALSLALNEITPPEAIPKLLTVLPSEVLSKLVKKAGVRHLVSRQARRLLMERADS